MSIITAVTIQDINTCSLSRIFMLDQASDFVEKVGYCLLFPVMMLKTRIHWLRAANQPKSFPQGGCFLSHHDDRDEDDADDDGDDDDDDGDDDDHDHDHRL